MVISLFYTNKKLIFFLNTDAKVLLSSPYSYHISKIKNHKYLTYSKTEFFAFKKYTSHIRDLFDLHQYFGSNGKHGDINL